MAVVATRAALRCGPVLRPQLLNEHRVMPPICSAIGWHQVVAAEVFALDARHGRGTSPLKPDEYFHS